MRTFISLIYVIQIYTLMPVFGLVFAPWALFSRKGARMACKSYARWCMFSARHMLGLDSVVRGPVPQGEVLIAAKHQSFLDIMMLFEALPAAKFIMKREILRTPVIGQYTRLLGCVAVDRGKRGGAIKKMAADVRADRANTGQLVIYPQGTRAAPGEHLPYKVGTTVLYQELGAPCVPVATNVGLFWPRKGIKRYPGQAIVEFLPEIPPGLPPKEFAARLEKEVEAASDALMREAGYDPDQ